MDAFDVVVNHNQSPLAGCWHGLVSQLEGEGARHNASQELLLETSTQYKSLLITTTGLQACIRARLGGSPCS